MEDQFGRGTNKTSRRSFLQKVGVGLFAFVPTARALATASTAEAQSVSQVNNQPNLLLKLADIALLDSADSVKGKHGQPQVTRITDGYGGWEWVYAGFTVVYALSGDSNLQVKSVYTTSPSGAATSNGIRVGDVVSNVRSIPGLQFREPSPQSLIVDLAPGRNMVFMHTNGVVSSVSLNEDACPTCTSDNLPS